MTTIRQGKPGDTQRLREIQQRTLAEPWPELLETAVQGQPPVFVIETSRPVGYVIYLGDGEVAYVPELAICPDHQRQGYGSQLLSYLCSQLSKDGFEELRLTVRTVDDRARSFYSSHGFEHLDRIEDHFERCDGLLLGCPLPADES